MALAPFPFVKLQKLMDCESVTIEQSGVIDLNYKVSWCYDLPCSHLGEKRKDI